MTEMKTCGHALPTECVCEQPRRARIRLLALGGEGYATGADCRLEFNGEPLSGVQSIQVTANVGEPVGVVLELTPKSLEFDGFVEPSVVGDPEDVRSLLAPPTPDPSEDEP